MTLNIEFSSQLIRDGEAPGLRKEGTQMGFKGGNNKSQIIYNTVDKKEVKKEKKMLVFKSKTKKGKRTKWI